MEDLKLDMIGVRDEVKCVVQYIYGDDGMNATCSDLNHSILQNMMKIR